MKLRWQAAHVYSMESTTCDVSPNFLLRSLVALRRPRSSGLYEAEDKTTTLQSRSTAVLYYSHVWPQYYTSHVQPQYYTTVTFDRSTTLVTFDRSTTLQSRSTTVLHYSHVRPQYSVTVHDAYVEDFAITEMETAGSLPINWLWQNIVVYFILTAI